MYFLQTLQLNHVSPSMPTDMPAMVSILCNRIFRKALTSAELAQEFGLHANQIVEWKQQMQERVAEVFGGCAARQQPAQPDIKVMSGGVG